MFKRLIRSVSIRPKFNRRDLRGRKSRVAVMLVAAMTLILAAPFQPTPVNAQAEIFKAKHTWYYPVNQMNPCNYDEMITGTLVREVTVVQVLKPDGTIHVALHEVYKGELTSTSGTVYRTHVPHNANGDFWAPYETPDCVNGVCVFNETMQQIFIAQDRSPNIIVHIATHIVITQEGEIRKDDATFWAQCRGN